LKKGKPGLAITLALDAEGGDNAPDAIVEGALQVAAPDLKLLLVGRREVIEPCLAGKDHEEIEIVESSTVVTCEMEPASAIRRMQDSSIAVGCKIVAEGRAEGFISAGSTGAMLAGSLLFVKRAAGIKRPAIVTVLPGERGPVVLLDAGANADCKPENLLEFGILGAAFASAALGKTSPKVGLLNIGEEREKGSELARAGHDLLRESDLEFIGNIEGRDVLSDVADVVVTDGFTGNVALKLLEGCSSSLFSRVREAAGSSPRARIGGLLLRPALRGVKAALDPEEYGGTYLLGVRGLVVICHGNSSSNQRSSVRRRSAAKRCPGYGGEPNGEVGHLQRVRRLLTATDTIAQQQSGPFDRPTESS